MGPFPQWFPIYNLQTQGGNKCSCHHQQPSTSNTVPVPPADDEPELAATEEPESKPVPEIAQESEPTTSDQVSETESSPMHEDILVEYERMFWSPTTSVVKEGALMNFESESIPHYLPLPPPLPVLPNSNENSLPIPQWPFMDFMPVLCVTVKPAYLSSQGVSTPVLHFRF